MTPSAARASYRRLMNQAGETITVRRYSGTGVDRAVSSSIDVLAKLADYAPQELVGTIKQGDRKLIIMTEDAVAAGLVLKKNDKVAVIGKEFNIEGIDDWTARIQGQVIAYLVQVRG